MSLQPISETIVLVSAVEGTDAEPSVPKGTVQCHFQNERGVAFSRRFEEPSEVAELLALWKPYKAAVDAAIAATPPQPWPPAPRFVLVLTPIP